MNKETKDFYIQSLLAGTLIGMGDLVYVVSESHILGSFLFSLGLLSILIKGRRNAANHRHELYWHSSCM